MRAQPRPEFLLKFDYQQSATRVGGAQGVPGLIAPWGKNYMVLIEQRMFRHCWLATAAPIVEQMVSGPEAGQPGLAAALASWIRRYSKCGLSVLIICVLVKCVTKAVREQALTYFLLTELRCHQIRDGSNTINHQVASSSTDSHCHLPNWAFPHHTAAYDSNPLSQ